VILVLILLVNLLLDKTDLDNYRSVSYLLFLSKLTERIVKHRLMVHLSKNNLLNSFQSSYVKSRPTGTTLLSDHDYIFRAMSLQQITCPCFIDLSATFDSNDHSILVERLSSRFGFNNTVLN
jgi:hypothetical protein